MVAAIAAPLSVRIERSRGRGRRALAKLAAASYHEPSARDARRRIVDFFDTHLKP